MANAFEFEANLNDKMTAEIIRLENTVRRINPLLDKTTEGLKLGGNDSADSVSKINKVIDGLSRSAKDSVQHIGDIVPPLKMVTGLTAGLGGAVAAINAVKNNLVEFANYGYRIDTISKNISMTTHAFQELTGAMVENGSKREDAESALVDLYGKAEKASFGQNNEFMALLRLKGIDLHLTKEGLVDVGRLLDDINKAMQTMSPGKQAIWLQEMGLSPELLSYLRNTTDEVQRLKDQAQRDGLILSDQDVTNALAFKQQMNEISAAYDGMILKTQAWLGQSETLMSTIDQIRQIMVNGFDNVTVGNILTFNRGGAQADLLRKASGDEKFKNTLSFKERMDLNLGYASEDLIKKLREYYPPDLRQGGSAINRPQVPALPVLPGVPYNERANNARGLRNNNPGNVRSAPNAVGNDGEFEIFSSSEDGLSAMARQLMLYGDRGNSTLNGIISTYAPSSENNTRAYIQHVAQMTGFDPNQRLDLHDPVVLQALMAAMIKHENKTQPFSGRDLLNSINTAVNDEKWSGKRDPGTLNAQRGEYSSESIFRQPEQGGAAVTANAGLVDAFRAALQDSGVKIELTIINPQTGERKTVTGNGPKVSTAMPF
ncbi:hypothetical protein [Brenneria corticis]|uniref:Uncharacterized protein n=1 Tax=Brenneria corticis TaxID=2173106 RepID=A0A2U1TU79_9GAMM|nr:hypothetical protein [Brenneria sp. CFCC 11842]PWC12961.1 hypothetical protein DDT56_16140 [Brenneria sp. CFCC 11842]